MVVILRIEMEDVEACGCHFCKLMGPKCGLQNFVRILSQNKPRREISVRSLHSRRDAGVIISCLYWSCSRGQKRGDQKDTERLMGVLGLTPFLQKTWYGITCSRWVADQPTEMILKALRSSRNYRTDFADWRVKQSQCEYHFYLIPGMIYWQSHQRWHPHNTAPPLREHAMGAPSCPRVV